MKKFIASVAALTLICGAGSGYLPLPNTNVIEANAGYEQGKIYDGVTDDGFKFEVYGSYNSVWNGSKFVWEDIVYDYVVITGYSGSSTTIEIPATIDDFPVTKIARGAFYNSKATKVVISDNVTSIGVQAFADCKSLFSVTMGKNVEVIDKSAFEGCSALVRLNLNNKLVSIGETAFRSCSSLYEAELPNSIMTLDSGAFMWCPELTKINIPDSVLTIGARCFEGDKGIEEMVIPEDVATIGEGCFTDCTKLKSVTLPSNLTKLSDGVFQGCTSLASIDIPDSMKTIGNSAFSECESLTEIKLPNSVTTLGKSSFYGCKSVKEFTIPAKVTAIPDSCFMCCDELVKVNFPENLKSIGTKATENCPKLKEASIPKSVTTIGDYAFNYYELYHVHNFKYESDFIIKGYKGTAAESYAKDNELTFIDLESAPAKVVYGDVNGDSNVTVADAVAIMQFLGNKDKYNLSAEARANADCYNTGDGITGSDALTIQKVDAGLIKLEDLPIKN